jgi:leucyl aminopeptidase
MDIHVSTTAWTQTEGDWLIVGISEGGELSGHVAGLDAALDGTISRLLGSEDLKCKLGETLAIHDAQGIAAQRVLLVGLGPVESLDRSRFERAMMSATRTVATRRHVAVVYAIPEINTQKITISELAEVVSIASRVGSRGQDAMKAEPGHFALESATVLTSDCERDAVKDAVTRGMILGDAINLTRELVNATAQDMYPEVFAARAQSIAKGLGLVCEVLDQERLEEEKMGSLLAVARGSDRPPRVVTVEYFGAGEDAPILALVGKGVTFDSGGLSIKPSEGMITMKADMAGAATVLGAITAIARMELPVNVIGYMGLVENMINGSSYKLGDILTARNGVTIEVQNTDAEGRLVLADVLSYAVDRGVDRMIDLATLTGACVVALGEDVTGVFSNNQEWCDEVLTAAATAGEDAWQLPTFDLYSELLKSDVADCRNIGGRWGGAITAAKFLEKFVSGKPWVHLDIAGPSFVTGNKPHREGGATGCMVRTLVETAVRACGK